MALNVSVALHDRFRIGVFSSCLTASSASHHDVIRRPGWYLASCGQ